MPHITLTPEQARVWMSSNEAVEVRDETGNVLARMPTPSDLQILAGILARRETNQEYYPSADVQARLARLSEIREREGMTLEKMHDLLRRMRAGETV